MKNMTDPVAATMAEASATRKPMNPPKKGERFRCEECGMEIQVTADCGCHDGDHVQFECCGKDLIKV